MGNDDDLDLFDGMVTNVYVDDLPYRQFNGFPMPNREERRERESKGFKKSHVPFYQKNAKHPWLTH